MLDIFRIAEYLSIKFLIQKQIKRVGTMERPVEKFYLLITFLGSEGEEVRWEISNEDQAEMEVKFETFSEDALYEIYQYVDKQKDERKVRGKQVQVQ